MELNGLVAEAQLVSFVHFSSDGMLLNTEVVVQFMSVPDVHLIRCSSYFYKITLKNPLYSLLCLCLSAIMIHDLTHEHKEISFKVWFWTAEEYNSIHLDSQAELTVDCD